MIHSTPLWLAAELGIIGLLIFLITFLRIMRNELRQVSSRDMAGTFIILVLVAFAVVATFHDVMYQRSLWLLLGAALALSTKEATARSRSEER